MSSCVWARLLSWVPRCSPCYEEEEEEEEEVMVGSSAGPRAPRSRCFGSGMEEEGCFGSISSPHVLLRLLMPLLEGARGLLFHGGIFRGRHGTNSPFGWL